jgi:hypothetical protein
MALPGKFRSRPRSLPLIHFRFPFIKTSWHTQENNLRASSEWKLNIAYLSQCKLHFSAMNLTGVRDLIDKGRSVRVWNITLDTHGSLDHPSTICRMHTAHPAACNNWHSVFVSLLSHTKFCVQIHFCGCFLIGTYWGYTLPQLSQILWSNSQATGGCTLLKGNPQDSHLKSSTTQEEEKLPVQVNVTVDNISTLCAIILLIFVLNNIWEAYTRPMAIWYKLHADLYTLVNVKHDRSQCPRGLRRGSASTYL